MPRKVSMLVAVMMMIFSIPDFAAAPTDNIVDIAFGNPDFSILVAALQKAELVETLQGAGPYTVFAPTNAAFESS